MNDYSKAVDLIRQTAGMFDNNKYEVTVKGKFDFVTQVDLQVQEFIREGLAGLYPEIGFLAEEQEDFMLRGDDSVWILDPVDGTTNMIHNFRHSAVSLALLSAGELEFGAVYNPYTDEMFSAQRGGGAFLNGRPIHVTDADAIDQALVAFGTSPYEKRGSRSDFDLIHDVFVQCQDIRRTGSAALDICYVASGRIDAFFEKSLKPWDFAAGAMILAEAGGRITDWSGAALGYEKKSTILATNGFLHDWFLGALK